MARSVANEMMSEFLQRQKEYEKIYRTYQHIERRVHSSQSINNEPHKIRDAVKKAHSKYIESCRSLRSIKKNERIYETSIRNSELNVRPREKKIHQQKEKQIDLGLVLIIVIPIICILTILSELF